VEVELKTTSGRIGISSLSITSVDGKTALTRRILRDLSLDELFHDEMATESKQLSKAKQKETSHKGRMHTEDELRDAFVSVGDVASAKIVVDRMTGKSRGFGFVEMPNDQEAAQAVEHLDNTEINGRTMAVSIAENRGGTRPQNDNRSFDKTRGGDFKRNDRPNTDFKSDYKKLDEKPSITQNGVPTNTTVSTLVSGTTLTGASRKPWSQR
jgi:hypothetical protein